MLDSAKSQNLADLNSSLGMQFRTCEKFWESTDSGLVLSQNFSQIQKPHRNPKDLRAKRSNQYFDFDSQSESPTKRTQNTDSAKSQNLIKNNSVRSTKNSPASWCKKSESKGAEVPPADFLLEAEKRGTPPKSEKAAAFWRVGGAGRGVQPFLREESSEISGEGSVESINESQSGLPRRFCESARNDEYFLNVAFFAETTKIPTKYALKG